MRSVACRLLSISLTAGMFLAAGVAAAQNYPVKPIHMLVGYEPGGAADITARIVAQKLAEPLGQPVVVENRPGGGGSIANQRTAAAPPDGYTLVMMTSSSTLQSVVVRKLPYNIERDLLPVALVVISPYLMVVHPSVPARNAQELITLARRHPGKLNYASAGVGTSSHFMGELLNQMAHVKIEHIPYKGGAGIGTATASGQIDLSFPTVPAAQPFVQSGKVRALAITSASRMSLYPQIPTLNESVLPNYVVTGWVGVLAPAGVPQDIIARLNAAVSKVLSAPDMKQALNKQGLEPQPGSPAHFAAFIKADIAQNMKFVQMTGVRVE